MAFNLKTFTTRAVTAAIFVAVLLSSICFNFVLFSSLFFIIAIWGLYEFYRLSEKLGAKPYKAIGILSGIFLFCYAIICDSNIAIFFPTEIIWPFIIAGVFFTFIAGLFDKKPNSVLNIAYTILGIVYVIVPFILLLHISCIDRAYTFNHVTKQWYNDCAPYNPHYILGIVLLIWANDSAAYLVGSFLGKHKLFERISPGKTWEGTIGATLLIIGCSYIIAQWYPELALKHWIVISVFVSVFGTLGDLVQSMLKRQAGVKDSGKIMPGHGGILDRFDSLIFVSPFIYAYLSFIH